MRNEGQEGERLFINSILQDQNKGSDNGKLTGFLTDANNNSERVEVYLTGSDTLDCCINVDGIQIFPAAAVREQTKDSAEKRNYAKNNQVLLFVIIMIICAITFFSMRGAFESELPQNFIEPVVSDSDSPVSSDPSGNEFDTGQDIPQELIEKNFTWTYGDRQWSYMMKIPKSACDFYKTVDRQEISNYSYYVKDTADDKYLEALVEEFKSAAEKENYSEYDIINNIICFVQNLNYVSDIVGTGYDEYPKFPLETLADEGGDCEDSAILLASLLRELGYDTVLIQLPNHMAVGLKGDENVRGVYYEVDGVRYFYIETTSTGWKIGEVPDEVENETAKILSLN
ncbi:hypothetical protein [Sinanaerobacter chloroacetimidivorans]|uniref:hypothetical protein n=1 Tax=Sinanaerobacter chloroacetimidivorans TaxID=2818044 RepID=UPI001D0473CE|nr:hypothetical protein [Sinanaerobacter chloroacetimidivorans]